MKKIAFLLSGLMMLPLVTTASFSDIYRTWTERLLGNPTAMYEQMQSFSSYGQKTTLDASFTSSADEIFQNGGISEGHLHLTTDIHVDKKNNIAGNMQLSASGSIDTFSGAISAGADLVVANGTLYVKPTITQLPEGIPSEQQVGLQLLDGKWIQINEPGASQEFPLPAMDSVVLAKQLTDLVHTTPILKPTKELTRNGYKIYLIQIDPTGVERLVAGVMRTVMSQSGIPYDESMSITPVSDFEDLGIKTIGVIGKKGDEIKMGMIIKNKYEPVHVLLSSTSTSSISSLTMKVKNNETKEAVFTLGMESTIPMVNQRDIHITFGASPENIQGKIAVSSTIYDAGNQEITAPTGAILLQNLMQESMR